MLLLVTVHGEKIELDVPPATVDRLYRVAHRKGKRPGQLATEILERCFPDPDSEGQSSRNA